MATFDISLRQPTGFDVPLQDPYTGSDRIKSFQSPLWPKAPSKYWNGTSWEFVQVKVWDGADWVD